MSETKKSTKPEPTPVAASTPKAAKPGARKNESKIDKCTCLNEYQDKLYGKGMRLKNSTTKGFKCTVCSKIQ